MKIKLEVSPNVQNYVLIESDKDAQQMHKYDQGISAERNCISKFIRNINL